MRLRLLGPVLLTASLSLGAAGAARAATITPSHLAAGKTTTVKVHVPGCHGPSIELFGGVIPSGSQVVPASNPDKPAEASFGAKLAIKTGAHAGAHTLTVRCSGANAGAVKITVTGGSHKSGSHAYQFRLGWVYTSHQVPGETDGEPHVGAAFVARSVCPQKIARQVVLPTTGRIYNARADVGATFKLGGDGKFHADVYIGATLHPGVHTVKATCENAFGLPLSHPHIPFHLVRHPFTSYKTPGEKDAKAKHLALPSTDVYATFHTGADNSNDPPEDAEFGGVPRSLSVPACEDPKAGRLTIASPGLAPHKQTSSDRTKPNEQPDTDIFGAYSTVFNFGDVVAGPTPGVYPVTLSCGTGVVATGKIRVTAK